MNTQNYKKNLVVGASFSLHPMSDDFENVIKAALHKTDASNVWMKTDDVTTTVQGKLIHVFDVTQSILIYAAKTDKHIAFQATYSFGCSGDSKGSDYLTVGDVPVNLRSVAESNQYAAAKFSLYPLDGGNYMDTIYEQIDIMKNYVIVTPAYHSTKLEGGIVDIFNGLGKVFQAAMDSGSNHTVMTVSISVNSPSHKR